MPEHVWFDTAVLDQHMLANPESVRTLVDTARPTARDVVADLGAGTGAITRELIRRKPRAVYAVEIDHRFVPYLEPLNHRFGTGGQIWGDILTTRIPETTKVVANPPFRITEQLIGWLHRLPALVSASLVMGRSFGVSAMAEPGTPDYNRLSLAVRTRFVVTMVASLPATDFQPRTRTPACIVHLVPKRSPESIDVIVATAFEHRSGSKVKDLVWRLGTRDSVLGDALRTSNAVRSIYQRRLQQLTANELSAFMAELHRLTGVG